MSIVHDLVVAYFCLMVWPNRKPCKLQPNAVTCDVFVSKTVNVLWKFFRPDANEKDAEKDAEKKDERKVEASSEEEKKASPSKQSGSGATAEKK